MNEKRSSIPQHEPLRVPQGWLGQARAFVIQLERIITDIYKRIANNGNPWRPYTDHTVDTTKITEGTVTVWTNNVFCCVRLNGVKFGTTGDITELVYGLPKALETVDTYAGGANQASVEQIHFNTVYIGRGWTYLKAHIYTNNTSTHWYTLIYPIDPMG